MPGLALPEPFRKYQALFPDTVTEADLSLSTVHCEFHRPQFSPQHQSQESERKLCLTHPLCNLYQHGPSTPLLVSPMCSACCIGKPNKALSLPLRNLQFREHRLCYVTHMSGFSTSVRIHICAVNVFQDVISMTRFLNVPSPVPEKSVSLCGQCVYTQLPRASDSP